MEERALEATERTDELREDTEDTLSEEEPELREPRGASGWRPESSDLKSRRGERGLWGGEDLPE